MLGGLARQPTAITVLVSEQQSTAVTLAERALLHQLNRLGGQIEQTHEVADRPPATPDPPAHVLARQPQLLDQRSARSSLLDRVEILARHVLDERRFQRLRILALTNDRRDALQACDLRGAPASLTGNQLVAAPGPWAD